MSVFDELGQKIRDAAVEDARSKLGEGAKEVIESWANEVITPEQAAYNAQRSNETAEETLNRLQKSYTPQIKVNDSGTGLVVYGTQNAVDSSTSKELQKYLEDVFKYSDLKSENVANAINELNNSLADQIGAAVHEAAGGNYDYYKDYQNAVETMNRQNPMGIEKTDENRAKYGIWGYDKDGKRVQKLPQEWIDYWREEYDRNERAGLFNWSKAVADGTADTDPSVLLDYTMYTPYLVMSGGEGGDTPMYGFDSWDQIVASQTAFSNELKKLGKGISDVITGTGFAATNFSGHLRKNHLNDIAHDLGHAEDVSSSELPLMGEEAFNEKIKSLDGKKYSELTKEEQAFLAAALADNPAFGTSSILSTENKGLITEVEDYSPWALDSGIIDSDKLAGGTSYSSYKNARDNISTMEKYKGEEEKQYEKNKEFWSDLEDKVKIGMVYAPVSATIGAGAGVILRTLAESGLVSSLTGGIINLSSIGDDLAEGIIKLANLGSKSGGVVNALNKPLGKFLLTLATEIPEDVIQTAVDNVIIGNGEENETLLTPDNIASNTVNNLIFRAVFGVGSKTLDFVSTRNAIKKLISQAPQLEVVDPDVLYGEYNEFKNARQAGDEISFDSEGRAVIKDADGNTKTLENVRASFFNNTGDEQLDAIGEAWRATHPDSSDVLPEDIRKTISSPDAMVERLKVDRNELDANDLENSIPISKYFDDFKATRIEDPAEIDLTIDNKISPIVQRGYYAESGEIRRPWEGREVMAIATLNDPELRNAALNKAYDVYYELHPEEEKLSFDAWLDRPITVYRRYFNGETVGNANANVLGYSMKEGGLSPKNHGDNLVELTITPRKTTGMILGADPTYKNEGEILIPSALVEGHAKYLDTQKIADMRRAAGEAAFDSAPDSTSNKWGDVRVRKNYYSDGASVQTTVDRALADLPTDPTQLNNWHLNAEESIMESFRQTFIPEFTSKYPTPEDQSSFVRNMDYLFHLQRREGVSVNDAVGKTYMSDGVEYKVTAEDIDFYKNYVEPQMEALREASQAALGVDTPTIVGYFPHTDYSPELMTSEELIQQGTLWKEYSGESAMVDGNFTTAKLSDDIDSRYRVFTNNMLWDAAGDRVAAARLMEEFHADGVDATPEQANNIIASKKAQADALKKSDAGKSVKKNLGGKNPSVDYDEINEKIKNSSGGYAQRIHDGYGGVYGAATGGYAEPGRTRTISMSDFLRKMQTPDGSLYDNGGRMVTAGDADAGFMAKRIFEENLTGQQVKNMFVEYLSQNNRRTTKGAEYIADKWMKKLVAKANNNPISRASLAADLQNLVYFEGASRVNRWIARADLSRFSKRNIGALDSFVFRQGLISRQLSDSGVMSKINKGVNAIIGARMKSLFWGNFKNGVLQTSECIRLFTEFELGDALSTIKRLATDADFRRDAHELVELIIPEKYSDVVGEGGKARMLEGTTEAMGMIANKSSYKNGVLNVEKLSAKDLKELGKSFDKFASSPVDFGENTKNLVIMAGILQEAQRKNLSGFDLFDYVNRRFERIGLAANDMGKLTAADNPFFRLATNLKSFGIREANMYLNNIKDLNGTDGIGGVVSYILKNVGWKGGLLLIMSKLGYGALSVLGFDPFGLMDDQYTGVDEEDYNWLDRVVSNPATNALLSGGFTSFIPQLYWASRQAYEGQITPADGMDRATDQSRGIFEFADIPFDDIRKIGMGFIPGYTQLQRTLSMTDLLNRGWATGTTGNKKYEAPDNPFDIATGYLFGPSNTPNARAYNQTPDYLQGFIDNGLAGVAQQWGREWGGYRQFDPIDQVSYTDWFNGTKADEAQWRAGYYHFKNRMQDVLSAYQEREKDTRTNDELESLKTELNEEIANIQDQLKAFTNAYISKHPEGVDEEKMNNLINVLNTYQAVGNETIDARNERKLEEWDRALNRYSQAGLPAITTYKGNDEGKTEVVYSPQIRAALQGRFGLPEEAAKRIEELYNDKWKDLNKQYRDVYYSTKGSKAKKAIQQEYISIVRQDLDPLVALYGGEIFNNDTVEDIVEDVFNSMIPKYGQTAKSYLKELYKDYHGTIRYSDEGNVTIKQINMLLDNGKTAQAKSLARTLLQRVQENRTSLTRAELERLQKILND